MVYGVLIILSLWVALLLEEQHYAFNKKVAAICFMLCVFPYWAFWDSRIVACLQTMKINPIYGSMVLASLGVFVYGLANRSVSLLTGLKLLGIFILPALAMVGLRLPASLVWGDLLIVLFIFLTNKRLVRLGIFQWGHIRNDGIFILSMSNLLFLYWVYRKIDFGWTVTAHQIIWAVASAVAAIVVTIFVGLRFQLFHIRFKKTNFREALIATFHSFGFVAFWEEIFFRGLLLNIWNALLPGGSPWVGLGVSSAAFAGIHYAGGVRHVLTSAFIGLVVGSVYLSTGSLIASLLTHGFVTITRILYVEFR